MVLPVAGGPESGLAVGALEGLGAGVQAHVHLKSALGGKGGAAQVAVEHLLVCSSRTQLISINNNTYTR